MATAPLSHHDVAPVKLSLPRFPSTWIITTCLVAAAFAPLLWSHGDHLWSRPHYQFFPFVLVGSAVLAWTRLRDLTLLQPGCAVVSWTMCGAAWLLLAVAELLNSSWLGAVAFMVLALAAVYTLGGRRLVWTLSPAWLFLGLAIPPPFGLDNTLVLALQNLSTRWSSALLDHFGIFHMVAGNVVEIAGRRFFVDEACTGINSLFSILACTLFYIFYVRVPVLRALALVVSALAWVLLANVGRIFLVVCLARRYDINVGDGWRHDALGVVLFMFALLMIWSTDRLLVFLTTRRRPNPANRPELAASRGTPYEQPVFGVLAGTLAHAWLGSWVTAVAFGLLLAVHIAFYGLPASAHETACVDPRVDADAFPKELSTWKREHFTEERRSPGSAYGEYSKTWFYRGPTIGGVFSLDYPFSKFHELTLCYRNQGWELEGRVEKTGAGNASPAVYYQATFKKSGLRTGHLFYCEFDQSGRVMEAERGGVVLSAFNRHDSILKRWRGGMEPGLESLQEGALYQFQLFVESSVPFTATDMTTTTDRFLTGFRAVHDRMFP